MKAHAAARMSPSLRRAFTAIVVFFLLLFGAVGITMHLAFSGHEPALDDGYYRRGLQYQEQLNRLRRGRESGWRLGVELPEGKLAPGIHPIVITLSGLKNETGPFHLNLRLERPASTRGRQMLTAVGRRAGNIVRFNIAMPVPAPGSWELYAAVAAGPVAIDHRSGFAVVPAEKSKVAVRSRALRRW